MSRSALRIAPMASSLFVPLAQVPADLAAVDAIVAAGFHDLGRPPPAVSSGAGVSALPAQVLGTFIAVDGAGPRESCWIAIDPDPELLSEDPACPYLLGVMTRGDWTFAGAVAYAFCRHASTCVFNDSGELDGAPRYDTATLRRVLAGPGP